MQEYRNLEITGTAAAAAVPSPCFTDEPFVQVKDSAKIIIRMQYPLRGMKNGEPACYMRRTVYEMLQKAAAQLDEGYAFVIWDAWRPFALQKELFTSYRADIIHDFHLENRTEAEQVKFISQFVADPVDNHDFPPAHTTGGALDLTLAENGRELDFGTGFDAFTDKTETVYYETHEEDENIRDNRRMLYHVMCSAGFVNLPSEWWHYEYGDQNWAGVRGQPAKYRGVWTKEEM